jgi:hypothetical protein
MIEMVSDDVLEAFVSRCQGIVDAHHAKYFPSVKPPVLSIMKGKRYARIVAEEGTNRYAWAFVDLTNADVLKPSGWKGPAEHARGNLTNEDMGMTHIGWNGPASLK